MQSLRLPMAGLAALLLAGCAMPLAVKQTSGAADGTVEQSTIEIVTRPELPPSPVYDVLVAEIAARREDYQTAFRHYLDLARRYRDPELAQRATHYGIFTQDERQAVEAANLWQELDPDNRLIDRVLANLKLRLGDVDAGFAHLERFLAAQADAGEGYRQVTAILVRVPDKSIVLEVAKRLAEAAPDSAGARFNYGVIARAAANLQLAADEMSAAVRLDPDWPQARINLSQVLIALERSDQALAVLAEGVTRQPDDRDLRLGYARMLLRGNRAVEARQQFEELANRKPGDPDVIYALALLALDARQAVEAERYLTALLAFEGRADDARYFLGRLEAQRDRFDAALAWYRQVAGGEYRVEAQIQTAAVLARQGHLDQALSALDNLQESQPQLRVRLLLVKGELLSNDGQRDRAMTMYDRALGESPDNNDLLFARAMLAERLDRLDLLESDLKRVLERDPDNASALNALGYTLTDRTERHQEALGYISRALELRPEDPAIIDSMGWVHYRLGRHDLALNYLMDAYARSQDPEIAAHLGEVLWETGDRDRARQVLQKAWEQDRENEVLKRTLERYR